MVTFSYRTQKIRWFTFEELVSKINSVSMTKLISINRCLPNATDTANWSEIYYEYQIK